MTNAGSPGVGQVALGQSVTPGDDMGSSGLSVSPTANSLTTGSPIGLGAGCEGLGSAAVAPRSGPTAYLSLEGRAGGSLGPMRAPGEEYSPWS